MPRTRRVLALAAAAILLPSLALAANAPAALVIEYSGKADPRLDAYSELADGTEVQLGASDSLTLLHYRSCKQVTVTGAKVKVAMQRLEVTGGKKTEEPGDQCPSEVKVATAGVSGGVLLRSVNVSVVPPDLNCVLVGDRRAQVAAIEVQKDGAPVGRVPVTSAALTLPETIPLLQENASYKLQMIGAGNKPMMAVDVSVLTADPAQKCLIRVQ